MKAIARRGFLKASAAAALVSTPAIAQSAQAARRATLRIIPQSNISVLDPTWSLNGITNDHALLIFDMLYGKDRQGGVRPQMAEGHTVSDDGLTWLIRLRDGLRFHDGEPVLARDCAASVRRWGLRDTFGQLLLKAADTIDGADDRTVRFRLKRPFPRLIEALAHPIQSVCPIMPARIAAADDQKPIVEMIGSGPYRFLPDEFRPGSSVAYRRFDGYIPRNEAPDRLAGGKRANFERVEWRIVFDSGTSAAALQAGEVDWWHFVDPNLVPLLRRTVNVKATLGANAIIRFNCLYPPFDNVKLRRAVLEAIDQTAFMEALVGPGEYRTCFSMYGCGQPNIAEIGAGLMRPPKDIEKARAAIAAAGYAGEKAIVLSVPSEPTIAPFGPVLADLLRKLGMNVDVQESDWSTMFQRANNMQPVDRGGWSAFPTWKSAVNMADPTSNQYIRGLGKSGYAGWFESAYLEALFDKWIAADSDAESVAVLDEIQRVAFEEVPFVPLGHWNNYTAYGKTIDGVLTDPAVAWNIRRI